MPTDHHPVAGHFGPKTIRTIRAAPPWAALMPRHFGTWVGSARFGTYDDSTYCNNIKPAETVRWYRVTYSLLVFSCWFNDPILLIHYPIAAASIGLVCGTESTWHVTVGRPSVHLSVLSIDSSNGGRWVCCWASCVQEIYWSTAGAVLQAPALSSKWGYSHVEGRRRICSTQYTDMFDPQL